MSETGPSRASPAHPPVPGARDVVEHLVGAGGVPGEDHAAEAAPPDEGDHRAQVLDALAEALEGRAGEVGAPAGHHVVTPGVELEVADAGGGSRAVSSRINGWPDENTDPNPCTQTSAVARRRTGSAITPSSADAVTRLDANEGGRDADRPHHARTIARFSRMVKGDACRVSDRPICPILAP